MGRPCVVLLALLLMFAAGSSAVGSEVGNIHFGNLFVHPRVGVELTYDDNIFLLGPEKVDDFIFKLQPGVDLDFTHQDKSVRLNYLAEFGWYADNSDYDYDNHLLDAAVDLQFVSGLMVFVGNVFRITNDRLTYEFLPLIERRQNTTGVKVGYEVNDRLSFRASYDHAMIDYQNREYEVYDRDEDIVDGTVFYRIFQRISLLGEVEYRWIDYDTEGGARYDGEGLGAYLGVTGQITPKMVALVKGGYQQRDYDGPREDFDGFSFGIDIIHRTTETLFLNIGASREAVESTFATNNYFASTQARAGLEKLIGPKISVDLSGFYANSDYPETTLGPGGLSERDDDIWGVSVGAKYRIQPWLTTRLWYTHEERNSNHNTYDYEDNRVSLGVTAVF